MKEQKFIFVIVIFIVSIIAFVLGRQQLGTLVPFVKPYTASPLTIKKVGILRYIKSLDPMIEPFKNKMTALGYKEGVNVIYITSEEGGSPEKISALAEELINKHVDVIYAITTVAAKAAHETTNRLRRTDLPIVFVHADSPVENGIIQSYHYSGNHLTGIAVNISEITEKKLEFLLTVDPKIKKIGIIDAEHVSDATVRVKDALMHAAEKFDITIVKYPVRSKAGPGAVEEVKKVTSGIKKDDIDAFFQLPGPVSGLAERSLIEITTRLQLPSVWLTATQVEQGGLFGYAHDLRVMGEQSAFIVDQVLRGITPQEIPILFAEKNQLILNLKTAREIGVTFPTAMFDIAERRIE